MLISLGHENLSTPSTVQWVSWLSHTRPDPPTFEVRRHVSKSGYIIFTTLLPFQELRADLERRRRVLHNVAVLEARDQEERARISAASAPSVTENPPQSIEHIQMGKVDEGKQPVEAPEPPPHSSRPTDIPRHFSRPSPNSELPPIEKDRDWQPQAWMPQGIRRRGG